MSDVTVNSLSLALKQLIKDGFGELPVRVIMSADMKQVFTHALKSFQVFEDPDIGPFVSLTCDNFLSEYLKSISPRIAFVEEDV